MPFERLSDDAATHAKILAIPRKDRAAVWGLVVLSATWSAQQLTDGWVPDEMVANNAPSDAEARRLMRIGVDVGLVRGRARHIVGKRSMPGWDIEIDHDDKLLHNRSAEEIALEKAQRVSAGKIGFDVRMFVIARDGDQCRYCAKPVTQHDTKGNRQRHLDHVDPDGPSTADNLVVACAECNGRKKDRSLAEAGLTLLPTPQEDHRHPHYTDSTRRQLIKHGYLPDPLQPRPTDGTTASADAPRIARPVDENHRGSDLVVDVDETILDHLDEVAAAAGLTGLAATGTDPPPAKGHPPGVSRVGTGRAGQGRLGQVREGSAAPRRRPRGGRRQPPGGPR